MMRYLLLLSTLTLSLMFSSGSSAEWTQITNGWVNSYLDLDGIRKNNGYVYVWMLSDFIKPLGDGTMSAKVYQEVDCKALRSKNLTFIYYRQPMGEGEGDSQTPLDQGWGYPPPESGAETMMNKVCAQ